MKFFTVFLAATVAVASATPLHFYNPFDKKDYCAAIEFTEPWQCAVLFDDNKCKGWELPISQGYTELSFSYKNDAESAVIREGMHPYWLVSGVINHFNRNHELRQKTLGFIRNVYYIFYF